MLKSKLFKSLVVAVPTNRFYMAAQYHPEFLSRPNRPEGIFAAFVKAALDGKEN